MSKTRGPGAGGNLVAVDALEWDRFAQYLVAGLGKVGWLTRGYSSECARPPSILVLAVVVVVVYPRRTSGWGEAGSRRDCWRAAPVPRTHTHKCFSSFSAFVHVSCPCAGAKRFTHVKACGDIQTNNTPLLKLSAPLPPSNRTQHKHANGVHRPDSSTALRVMQLLSQVASVGTTVVCSVHQPRPEVVRLIDKVWPRFFFWTLE